MMVTDRELEIQNARLGTPISRLGRLTTASLTYLQVAEWTVASSGDGDLHEISMFTDGFTVTEFRLTIGGSVQWTDQIIGASLTIPFRANRLAGGVQVLLEAQSTDGTQIVVDGAISGSER